MSQWVSEIHCLGHLYVYHCALNSIPQGMFGEGEGLGTTGADVPFSPHKAVADRALCSTRIIDLSCQLPLSFRSRRGEGRHEAAEDICLVGLCEAGQEPQIGPVVPKSLALQWVSSLTFFFDSKIF